MLGASRDEERESLNDAISSQAKTAQIQGIMKLFAVSLQFLRQQPYGARNGNHFPLFSLGTPDKRTKDFCTFPSLNCYFSSLSFPVLGRVYQQLYNLSI